MYSDMKQKRILEGDAKKEAQPIVYTRRNKRQDKQQVNLDQEETHRNQRPSSIIPEIKAPSPATPLPPKWILHHLLDNLQRHDPRQASGGPVNPSQVPEYYVILEGAISTIRTKLHEDKYSTLEEFEEDVLRHVTDDSATFNKEDGTYFRQARSVHMTVNAQFDELRRNLVKIEKLQEKKRSGRKPRAIGVSCSRSENSSACTKKDKDPHNEGIEDIAAGESSGMRSTYKPPSSRFYEDDENSQQFQLVDSFMKYRESLEYFAKDLGPTPHKVAAKKLEALSLPQSHVRSEIRLDTPCLVPENELLMQQTIRLMTTVVRPESDEGLQMLRMNSYGSHWQNQFEVDACQHKTFSARPPLPMHGNMIGSAAGVYSSAPYQTRYNEQQQQPPLPMHGNMLGSAAGAYSSAPYQTRYYEQQQQQDLRRTRSLNLDLQLETRPPSPDHGTS